MIKDDICTGVVVSRWRARGGSRLLSLPAPCSTKGWRAAGPTGPPHTRTHHCRTTPHHPTATRTTNAEPRTLCALLPIMPLGGASPPQTDPCPLSLSLVHSHRGAAHRSHVRWRTLCSSTYAPACHMPPSPRRPRRFHTLIAATLTPATVSRLLEALLAVEGGQGGSRPLSLPAPPDPQRLWRPHCHHTHSSAPAILYSYSSTKYQCQTKQIDAPNLTQVSLRGCCRRFHQRPDRGPTAPQAVREHLVVIRV